MAVARTIPTLANPDLLTFTIKINEAEISRAYHIKYISVKKEINKIPTARLIIADGNAAAETFEVSNSADFIPGKEIEILLGYHSEEATVFKGIITSHANTITDQFSELVIECKDAAVKMTIGRNSRHYNEVTDKEVAEALIAKYSEITPDIEDTSIHHHDLVQFDTTDWDFMVSRMDSIGHICVVSNGKVSIKKPSLSAEPKLKVLFGATILDYHATINARQQCHSVVSTSWDFSDQQMLEVGATEPSWVEGGNLSNNELAEVFGSDPFKMQHSGKLSQEELQAWADAKLVKNRLSKIKGHVSFIGNNDLLPGDFIDLNGTGDRFIGKAIVSALQHECESGQWRTKVEFGLEPAWFAEKLEIKPEAQMGRVPSVQGLQVGIVTSIEDPSNEGRVRIKIPVVSAVEEGIWARVATLDAGDGRGTFFRPEIDDEVIVGFINNDPSHVIILGMLHSSAKPTPLNVAAANPEKGYVSREKIKMVFNDEEKSFTVETPAGKKFSINDDDGSIKLEDEYGNKIVMTSGGVSVESATSLTLKAGSDIVIQPSGNLILKPASNFTLSAGGGSEFKMGAGSASMQSPSIKLEGTGVTEIKGALVKIN